LVYCSNCGQQIADDAYFCSKCGTKTSKGKEENVKTSSEELKDAFYKVGVELERALTIAAKETQAAFRRAREDMQQKSSRNEHIVCPNCGVKNSLGSIFCNNCGKRLAPPSEEVHGV
jgi:uncharacterized membrane protein YvbJ